MIKRLGCCDSIPRITREQFIHEIASLWANGDADTGVMAKNENVNTCSMNEMHVNPPDERRLQLLWIILESLYPLAARQCVKVGPCVLVWCPT